MPVLGTFIAFIGHTVLAAASSVAFVQVFWWRLRKGRYSIKHINVLVSCYKSPFTLSSFPAWSPSTILIVAIAALANFMTVITVFAPGALSIISGYESLPCQVRVPALTAASSRGIGDPNSSNVLAFATRAVIEGYLPPLRQCNQTCFFDATYFAPAFDCSNIPSTSLACCPPTSYGTPVTGSTWTLHRSCHDHERRDPPDERCRVHGSQRNLCRPNYQQR